MLNYPDFSRPFRTKTDARLSDVALGAVLCQTDGEGREHPVAYASRTLSAAERNYAATERECLAGVWAVAQFRVFLWGRPFVWVMDHAALCYLHAFTTTRGSPGGR